MKRELLLAGDGRLERSLGGGVAQRALRRLGSLRHPLPRLHRRAAEDRVQHEKREIDVGALDGLLQGERPLLHLDERAHLVLQTRLEANEQRRQRAPPRRRRRGGDRRERHPLARAQPTDDQLVQLRVVRRAARALPERERRRARAPRLPARAGEAAPLPTHLERRAEQQAGADAEKVAAR